MSVEIVAVGRCPILVAAASGLEPKELCAVTGCHHL
jgi:hypothetical protein